MTLAEQIKKEAHKDYSRGVFYFGWDKKDYSINDKIKYLGTDIYARSYYRCEDGSLFSHGSDKGRNGTDVFWFRLETEYSLNRICFPKR